MLVRLRLLLLPLALLMLLTRYCFLLPGLWWGLAFIYIHRLSTSLCTNPGHPCWLLQLLLLLLPFLLLVCQLLPLLLLLQCLMASVVV